MVCAVGDVGITLFLLRTEGRCRRFSLCTAGTLCTMSSVTKGLKFEFLQAAQSSITGDHLCMCQHSLSTHQKQRSGMNQHPLYGDVLKHREVKGLCPGLCGEAVAKLGRTPLFSDPAALCTCTPDTQHREAELLARFHRVFSTRVHAFCSHVRLSREP